MASSSRRIAGRRSSALAITIRCFWPPLSIPLVNRVSYPSGRAEMNSWALEARAAASISERVAAGGWAQTKRKISGEKIGKKGEKG